MRAQLCIVIALFALSGAQKLVQVVKRPSQQHQQQQQVDDESRDQDPDYDEEAPKHAQYSFASSLDDTIDDNFQSRQETRDGAALKGVYSYSDGFFRRTVHYQADDKGYRVIKEEVEPIGNGPQYNPNGKADVSSSLAGSYSITADDFRRPTKYENKVQQPTQQNNFDQNRRPF